MSRQGPLRIAVADDEPDMLLFCREVLTRFGHEVVAEAATGQELVERCRATRPDLIITDVRMPDKDGIVAAATVNQDTHVPVILVTGHPDVESLDRAAADHVMAYLTKPVKPADLLAAVTLAMIRFGHFQTLAKETADLRQALEDRKVVERAKSAVMKRARLDEEEAFRRLQRLASQGNRKLIEIARQVVAAEEVFRQIEKV